MQCPSNTTTDGSGSTRLGQCQLLPGNDLFDSPSSSSKSQQTYQKYDHMSSGFLPYPLSTGFASISRSFCLHASFHLLQYVISFTRHPIQTDPNALPSHCCPVERVIYRSLNRLVSLVAGMRTCPELPDLRHAKKFYVTGTLRNEVLDTGVECSDVTDGNSCHYQCAEGYRLSGTPILTCNSSGVWEGNFPNCSSKWKTLSLLYNNYSGTSVYDHLTSKATSPFRTPLCSLNCKE